MLSKKIISTAMVFMISILGMSQAVAANVKLGYVNWNTLLAKSKPAKQAIARVKKEFLPREKKLKAQVVKLKKMQRRLAKESSVMSKSQVIKLQRSIRSLQRDIKRDNTELREDFSLRSNEERKKLYKKLKDAIQSYAKKEKYDIVISLGVLYYSKKVDITDKVLKVLAK